MLEKFNMLSVSQMNDQIYMTEIWKANNVDNYPLKIEKKLNLMKSEPQEQFRQGIRLSQAKQIFYNPPF